MHIVYPDRENFIHVLKETSDDFFSFIMFITDAIGPINIDSLKKQLNECVRVLKNGGVLFVQGRPEYLSELGVYLDRYLTFKYWIAVESQLQQKERGLPTVHAAVLLFTKGNGRFHIKRTRFPHQYCAFCGKTLKDWGGKAHLMHTDGYVISDVWKDLSKADNYSQLSRPVFEAILRMLDFESSTGSLTSDQEKNNLFEHTLPMNEIQGIVGPKEGIADSKTAVAEPAVQYSFTGFPVQKQRYSDVTNEVGDKLFDIIHHGDSVKILEQYPDNSIDLVFADPPYNLDKAYRVYDDELSNETYIEWCNRWLKEYARILKPTGSLYVLNLPRWTMYHATFLNQRLYFQNWIVWDAMAAPLGKVMPAHYGLLFYTKHPTDFTFNYAVSGVLDARYYCLRGSCIRKRKAQEIDDKMPLTDLWWDIHRIKHKRDRDNHPCQLPDNLMERIIRLSTNEGDIVLDALGGAGTTPVMAVKLGRRYVAIDIDETYVEIMKGKVAEVKRKGYVERESIHKPQRKHTKKELQLALRNLAIKLGRLPTPKDVQEMSEYNPEIFLDVFPTWGKALKAAKLEMHL